jgi:predicted PurR-regulated permease PerM
MTLQRQLVIWLVGFGLFIGFLFVFSGVLLPFVAGFAVAYFLDPAADRLESWGFPRALAAASIIIGFFAVMIMAAILLYPVAESQVVGFVAHLPDYLARAQGALAPYVQNLFEQFGGNGQDSVKALGGGVAQSGVKWLASMIGGLFSGGLMLFNILSLLLITPVVAFFLLRDWDLIVAKIEGWLPRQHEALLKAQFSEIDRVLAGFVRGQAMACLAQGVLFAIGWSLIGLEFGLVIGLTTGLLNFVPYAGSFFGLVLALAIALGQFWPDPVPILMVLGVFGVVQVLDQTIFTPRLVGNRVGLHPAWVLFALLGGGYLFGFVGVLVAVPVAAVIGVLVRFLLQQYLASKLFAGEAKREAE